MKKSLTTLALLVTVAGCTIFPTGGEPARKYTLSYTHFASDLNDLNINLLIDTPTVDSSLDTLRIVLKNSERSVEYFADAEWANRLTGLIHESLVHSFENTGKFSSISRPADGAKVDKILKVGVRGFYMDFFSEPPNQLARVDYLVQIIDKKSRKVIASKAFLTQTYAAAERIESYIQALNQAHLDATTQMINWTIETLKNARHDNTTDEKEND
ncbi:MAG: ABC-type transport auxiliary lipoprotein family protein [Alphaproteobacteria bacterium]